jgi:hypothetical protein
MNFLILAFFVAILFGMEASRNIFESGDMFFKTTQFLEMKDLSHLACCNRSLLNKITKNLEKFLSDDLIFFKESCDKNLKGYAELEARLNSIGSSFRIQKLSNGNFEISPTNHILPHELRIIVAPNSIRVRGNFGHSDQFDVELPANELMLSGILENFKFQLADIDSYEHANQDGLIFSYLKYPSASKFPQVCHKKGILSCALYHSCRNKISVSPQNIERFFHLCSTRTAETKISVLFHRTGQVERLQIVSVRIKILLGFLATCASFMELIWLIKSPKPFIQRNMHPNRSMAERYLGYYILFLIRIIFKLMIFLVSFGNIKYFMHGVFLVEFFPIILFLNLLFSSMFHSISEKTFLLDSTSLFIIGVSALTCFEAFLFMWRFRGSLVNFLQPALVLFYFGIPLSGGVILWY